MKRLNIGVDVSKLKLDICILDKNKKELEYLQIFNKENSIRDFIEYVRDNYKDYKIYLGYEATNTYMRKLQDILEDNEDIKSVMINPHTLYHYFKYIGLKEKTDKSDSYGIALFVSEKDDEYFNNEIDYKIKQKYQDYVNTIEKLKKIKVQLKNLKSSKEGLIDKELEEEIENITKKIDELEKRLTKNSIKEFHKDFPEAEKIREDIKGIGDYTLLAILPVINSAKNKTIKQIQAYFGLNPVRFESGSSVYKKPKISKKGNSIVRRLLYMNTLIAIRVNEIIKKKYERLVKAGKKKRVALVACMVHLLRAIFYKYQKYQIS